MNIGTAILNVLYTLIYYIGIAFCFILNVLDQVFCVMSGIDKVTYDGSPTYLIDVFFRNASISNAYWMMALIGIALCIIFTIIAVIRKAVDSNDKMRQSMGGILTGMCKAIAIILCMSVIMNVVVYSTNVLMEQVSYVFDNATAQGSEENITYTDDDYATMARVLNTIGNYSVNPSYNSRYNINSCFNSIRKDLSTLQDNGVFKYHYVVENGEESWQSALQRIVNAADISQDLNLDTYNESVSNAILSVMDIMRNDSAFWPLESYHRSAGSSTDAHVPIDRVVFLMCTMEAAKNPQFNENASLNDALRGPYFSGEKNYMDLMDVTDDFNLSDIRLFLLIIVALKLVWDFAVIIINCIARIFNLLMLYLIAPPVIATIPLDDGGKFKQWTTAFVVQNFGIFGTVIAMRLMLMFISVAVSSKLKISTNAIVNLMGQVLLVLGAMETAKRASGLITGILADNAGMQAITAGDMGESVRSTLDHGRNRLTGYGETGSLRKNGEGLRSMVGGGEKPAGGGGGGGTGDGNKEGGDGKKDGGSLPTNKGGASGNKPASSGTSGNVSGGGTSGGSLPKGGGGYTAKPNSQASFGGGFGTGNPGMTSDGTGPVIEMQDLSAKSNDNLPDNATREWGSVEEFLASDGGPGPDVPESFDEGLDWLPDGDVMTARTFAPTERIVGGDEGLDWLPDGDVMTAQSFAPTKTPPPPYNPPVPNAQRVRSGEDPLSQ